MAAAEAEAPWGSQAKARRDELGYSKAELTRRTGLHQATITAIEKSSDVVESESLRRYATGVKWDRETLVQIKAGTHGQQRPTEQAALTVDEVRSLVDSRIEQHLAGRSSLDVSGLPGGVVLPLATLVEQLRRLIHADD